MHNNTLDFVFQQRSKANLIFHPRKKKFTVLFRSLNESVRQVQICLADFLEIGVNDKKKKKKNSTHFSLVKFDDVTDKQGVVYLMCIVDFDIAFNRKFPPATSITSVTFQESVSLSLVLTDLLEPETALLDDGKFSVILLLITISTCLANCAAITGISKTHTHT